MVPARPMQHLPPNLSSTKNDTREKKHTGCSIWSIVATMGGSVYLGIDAVMATKLIPRTLVTPLLVYSSFIEPTYPVLSPRRQSISQTTNMTARPK